MKLESAYPLLLSKKEKKFEIKSKLIGKLVNFLNLKETLQKNIWLKISGFEGHTNFTFLESLQLMDHGFRYNNQCSGCGICSKACPVYNIEMVDGRPLWLHKCEQCFACLQWCPKESVQFGNGTYGGKRYYHPSVTLSDMLSRPNNSI